MKKLNWLFISFILFFSLPFTGFAKEPTNLSLVKQELIHYHDSGEYEKDIAKTLEQAMVYLILRLSHPTYEEKKPAIVLDIDETSLSNYSNIIEVDFSDNKEILQKAEDPAILPTLKLFQTAKDNNVAIFFLTGRPEKQRTMTEKNLKKAGFDHWEKIIMRGGKYIKLPAKDYKTEMRKQITEQGYIILLNIGDQESDLVGGYADKTFKVPNPYYLIP